MKYIKGQRGSVYSVSSLIPPAKGNDGSGKIWRLELITAHGSRELYATFRDMREALTAFDTVLLFMDSDKSMLRFGLGEGKGPIWVVGEPMPRSVSAQGGPQFPADPFHLDQWEDATTGIPYVYDSDTAAWVAHSVVTGVVVERGDPIES